MAKPWKDIKHKGKSPERISTIASNVAAILEPHCQPEDDCHCSEKTEQTITKLFYEKYSDQFEEAAGQVVDGKVTLYFYNPIVDQNVAASLNEAHELVVKDI